MRRVSRILRRHRVSVIYLVHGTFVGRDALGILGELARVNPALADQLRDLQMDAIERWLEDRGNFSQRYCETFERLLNQGFETKISVRLFQWSGENHHFGRAQGAVRLIDELSRYRSTRPQRMLVWGHSHGGNVLALVTNLLGGDLLARKRFFRAARSYYRWPFLGKMDRPVWTRIRARLPELCAWLPQTLDLVTMGTPVRYGWETAGYGRLLHFVSHRPAAGRPPDRVLFPPTLEDLHSAASGDLIQWLAVAGTNLPPPLWAWRSWLADIRLNRILQAGVRRRDLISRWRLGQRVHHEGTTFLVDYGPSEGHIGQHLAGHAVYTRLGWLLFHAEETVKQFYADE